MKTLKKNVQDFKNYMLEIEKKHIEVKKTANMSANNDNWSSYDSACAKSALDDSSNDISNYSMRILYTAYYIVKHNLNENSRLDYLMKLAEQFKKWYKNGKPDYDYVVGPSYFSNEVSKLVDKFTYEKDESNT